MDNSKKIYGYISLDGEKYAFAIDDYIGRIFNGVSGITWGENIEVPKILYGVTDQNYEIIIEVTQARKTTNCIMFSTPYYVIGRSNNIHYDFSHFNKISFVGGNINSILDPSLIYEDTFEPNIRDNGCCIKFKPLKDVTSIYKVSLNDKNVKLTTTIYPYQDRKDNKLGVTNSVFSVEFESAQEIQELRTWYKLIYKIVTLLVQQQNVDFDRITITSGENSHGEAYVYVKHDFSDLCDKKPIRAISIKEFDTIMDKFIIAIENDEFSINFLPKSNRDARYITYEDIKNICTALEFEYGKSDVRLKKEDAIEQLVKQVKELVKKYKNSHPELTEKSYNNINSNLKNWSSPVAEQFNALYENKKELIDKIINLKQVYLDCEKIQKIVTFRNNITHGSKPTINKDIVETAYALRVLVYATFLSRIGLSDDAIYNALVFAF